MGRLAVVLGSNANGPGGAALVEAAEAAGVTALPRHGSNGYALPHLIDHEANMRRLLDDGCDRVLAICSVGSLREEIPAGSLVCPDDFIAPQAGPTIFGDAQAHSAPGFDPAWRRAVLDACAAPSRPRDGGIYWQTVGPRFETPAEIRVLAAHAEVVGMTMAAECVIAGELGLRYAAICVVDNLANGVGSRPLSVEELELQRRENVDLLRGALGSMLPELR